MTQRDHGDLRDATTRLQAALEGDTTPQGLADRALAICLEKGWGTDWKSRGCYLHLEASEFIEAVRGKGTDSIQEEAGDVLFVLFSFMNANGVTVEQALQALEKKIQAIESGKAGRPAGE